jgi:hypothetical protein
MASRKRTPEQEARLRAVRRMQDDVYEGIGADRQYGPGGEEGVERESDPRSDARQMARSMTMAGTAPLRRLRGEDEGDPRQEARDLARSLTTSGTEPLRRLSREDYTRAEMAKKRRTKGY